MKKKLLVLISCFICVCWVIPANAQNQETKNGTILGTITIDEQRNVTVNPIMKKPIKADSSIRITSQISPSFSTTPPKNGYSDTGSKSLQAQLPDKLTSQVLNDFFQNPEITSVDKMASLMDSSIENGIGDEILLLTYLNNSKQIFLSSECELFSVGQNSLIRLYGEKEYFIAPTTNDIRLYEARISNGNNRDNGKAGMQFQFVDVLLTPGVKELLKTVNYFVPDFITDKVKLSIPDCDILFLQQQNVSLSFDENYGKTQFLKNSSVKIEENTDQTMTTIWSEGFEGAFPGSAYTVGDANSTNGNDYWDDISCDYHSGGWSIWCAANGDQSDCVNYDDNMANFVSNINGIPVSNYSNVQFKFWTKYNTESCCDNMKFYASGDGSNWTLVTTYQGSSTSWSQKSFTLTNYTNYYWDFEFNSDETVHNYVGSYLDDLEITGDAAGQPNLTHVSSNSTLSVNGTSVSIGITVINTGTATAASSEVGYYLSANTTWSSSDYLIGTDPVSSLSVNGTSNESITVDVVSAAPPGTYYIFYYIDHLSQVTESNEGDNIWYFNSLQVVIPTSGSPNLTHISANSSLTVVNTTVSIGITVINSGTANAASSEVGYYLSLNTSWSSSDYLIGTDAVSSLAVNGTSNESITVDVSSVSPAIPPGTYYIFYYIDHLGQVAESDEADNIWYWSTPQVTISGNPNLTIFTGTGSNNTYTYNGISHLLDVSTSVQNNGTGTANDFSVGFYLSTNTTISTTDYLIGSATQTSLTNGYYVTKSISVDLDNISGLPSGTYYVGVYYDDLLQVTELDETDNAFYYTPTIDFTGAGVPDIVVTPTSITINQTDGSGSNSKGVDPVTINNSLRIYIPPIPDSLLMSTFIDENGNQVDVIKVPGIPPSDFRMPIAYAPFSAVTLSNVPAFDWSFGCSATSAAMIAGYYDNSGYPNMYTGPTNGGIMPMTNASWGSVVINGETRKQCPLSATRNGVDGRTTRGHVDDYWVVYNSTAQDPYITNGWTQHTYGECTGDYMKTNQSVFSNTDGSTTFYYSTNGAPYTGTANNDGGNGFELFLESRGYNVTGRYNQYIQGYNGNTLGFTFNQFVSEINAGRPVLIHVTGHTMVGYGYDLTGNVVYIHDTWDYNSHTMIWGGSYSGMDQYGVSVFQLEVNSTNGSFTISNVGTGNLSITSISDNKNWLSTSGYNATPFNIAAGGSQSVNISIDWGLVGTSMQTGTVTIASNDPDEPSVTVQVTAVPTSYSLSVTPSSRNVSSSSGTTTFSVASNTSWTVSESASWFTVSPMSGSNNGTLTVSYDANSSINSRTSTISINGTGVSSVIVTVTQEGMPDISDILNLIAGWNLISFDVSLTPNTPIEVFASLITANNLQMVTGYQSQQGVFFDPNGLPFLNTLQNIIQGEGYWVKVQNATTLNVQGTAIPANLTINLLSGWNLISYWRPSTTTPAAAFATLISAGKLQMVTGYEQGGKFFDPNGPAFLNTLTEIKNGFGYWVKVNSNCTLTFP